MRPLGSFSAICRSRISNHFFALGSDPVVIEFIEYIRLDDDEKALHWLKSAIFHNNLTPRSGYNLAVIRKQDMEWLGWLGFGKAEDLSIGEISFAYALHTKYWRNGYATEALHACLHYCFDTLGVSKIFGECDQKNYGSARVMEKAGLFFELAYLEVDPGTGHTCPTFRYSICKEDWQAHIAPGG